MAAIGGLVNTTESILEEYQEVKESFCLSVSSACAPSGMKVESLMIDIQSISKLLAPKNNFPHLTVDSSNDLISY